MMNYLIAVAIIVGIILACRYLFRRVIKHPNLDNDVSTPGSSGA